MDKIDRHAAPLADFPVSELDISSRPEPSRQLFVRIRKDSGEDDVTDREGRDIIKCENVHMEGGR